MQPMTEVRPYFAFLRELGTLSEQDFLARVTVPHLYFPNLPELGSDELFTTIKFQVGQANSPAPLGEGQGIIPVAKAADGNAFAMMITMGRAPNNDLVIPDGRVSKFHAYFRQVGDRWMITDANSTNGTAVNGVQIAPDRSVEVHSGDQLEMAGSLRASFLLPKALYSQAQNDRVHL